MRKHISSYKKASPAKINGTGGSGEILIKKGFGAIDSEWRPTASYLEPRQTFVSSETQKQADKSDLDITKKPEEKSVNTVNLASDPRGGAVDTFSNYALRSAWKGEKMTSRKLAKAEMKAAKAGVEGYEKKTKKDIKKDKAERNLKAAKQLEGISSRQIEEQINTDLTARSAMKMIFKSKK